MDSETYFACTYLQETQTDDTALSKASFPVHVLPDNPVSKALSNIPKCGGPKLAPGFVAIVFMAVAPWAFMCQDCDSNASFVIATNSSRYNLTPASDPNHYGNILKVVLFSLYQCHNEDDRALVR